MFDLARLNRAVAALLKEAAETLILPRFRALGAQEVHVKSHATDLVTVADIEAEFWLSPRLIDLLPGSLALGEEAASRGEISLKVLDMTAPIWTIDPVDGTYNFVQGQENFCSMVGLVLNGQAVGGWIYQPTQQMLFTAMDGQGAYCQHGEDAPSLLSLETIGEDQLAFLPALVSHRFWKHETARDQQQHILSQLAPTAPTNCAGLNYCDVATGKAAFVAMATLTPWDHVPGTLLVREAGGEVQLNGGAYDPRIEKGALISGKSSRRMALAIKRLS